MNMDLMENIPSNLRDILKKAGLETTHKLMEASNTSLENLGITTEHIQMLRTAVAESLNIKYLTVNKIIETQGDKWGHISFGCNSLDSITKGGILTRGITEIAGESGVGKTQLLLQLCLMVQLPEHAGGLNKGAVFISTEDAFPSKRLIQLIESFQKRHSNLDIKYSDKIFIEHIVETKDLLQCVCIRLPNLMKSKEIGLIAIDSVAAIFRIESNFITRANNMRMMATSLLNLSDTYKCAVVCVNQVASAIDDSCANKTVPCLGLSWASLVRTRFQISKMPTRFVSEENNTEFVTENRKLDVIFSPDLIGKSCEFQIVPDGIVDSK